MIPFFYLKKTKQPLIGFWLVFTFEIIWQRSQRKVHLFAKPSKGFIGKWTEKVTEFWWYPSHLNLTSKCKQVPQHISERHDNKYHCIIWTITYHKWTIMHWFNNFKTIFQTTSVKQREQMNGWACVCISTIQDSNLTLKVCIIEKTNSAVWWLMTGNRMPIKTIRSDQGLYGSMVFHKLETHLSHRSPSSKGQRAA